MQELIEKYLEHGFGSMNKNDFEVFIFNEIINSQEHKDKSNYELSFFLKIPEPKIKRLRYEANFKYPIYEKAIKQEIDKSLSHAKVNANTLRCIELCLENEVARRYISAIMKKEYRFGDSSFNTEILRITIDDYEYLLKQIYAEEEQKIEDLLKNTKKDFKSNAFKDVLTEIIKSTTDSAINLSLSGLLTLFTTL